MPRITIYEYEAYPVFSIGEVIEDGEPFDRHSTRKVSHEFIARYNMVMELYGQMQKELGDLDRMPIFEEEVPPLHVRPFEELGEWIEEQMMKYKRTE